ncbi:MAG: UDP-N-acetylmuramoyl-L-alanyl-D-glutamate--2,6-diaminopimelate ligase [Patescibacteria group bacterium]|mgnify:CR=1 FL=1
MKNLRRKLLAPYHYLWARLSALWYGSPSRRLTVIGVTGTKGKSSVADMLYAIFTTAGHTTALASTIRFVLGAESRPNLFKMTLPGRGFIQKFLSRAAAKKCTHVIVEITSEAALQYRHLGLDLDALIFTNLQKEHVESHGSIENYFRAKFSIGEALVRSPKRPRSIIACRDDTRGARFLELSVENQIPFSLADATDVTMNADGVSFTYSGTHFTLSLPGEFNILNALAAIKTAQTLGVSLATSAKALRELSSIKGRVERIEAGQNFIVVVDYAHTPDSLMALYSAFPNQRKICVLGNTGGGRDTWKRPEMGRIADEICEKVILTNEDPYDEDPRAIIDAMAQGMKRTPEIIMDRREAIRAALRAAQPGDAVLVSGKGTDPFIMGARGTKIPWSDADVVREELERLLTKL